MIYAASLNVPVRKALKKEAIQSTLNKICANMNLDPETTNMSVVILGPKDFVGPKATQVQHALEHKHPDICVIYVYTSNADADLCDGPGIYKEQVRKINEKTILAAFEAHIGDHEVSRGKMTTSSADFDEDVEEELPPSMQPKPQVDYSDIEPGDDEDEWSTSPVGLPEEESVQNKVPKPIINVPMEEPEVLPEEPLQSDAPPIQQEAPVPTFGQTPVIPQGASTTVTGSFEDRIANVNSPEEWPLFKEALNHNAIVNQLVQENAEYEGLINMLEVLDKRIQAVWRDTALSPDEKFSKIKAIGLEKSTLRAGVNSINVEKAISIISTIVMSAQRTVDAKINSIDTAVYKRASDSASITDTSHIDKAIEERSKIQMELLFIGREILDIYKSVETLVSSEIRELDSNLPSSNAFINEMVKPIGTQIFTPPNTIALTKKISTALQENRLVWSQLEDKVSACINTLFRLCEQDELVIQYMQNQLNLLKSNHVEDVVVTSTLLKSCLQVFTGANNTGRSSTAITWSGILSRRRNTMLIDLTGRAKFREYGIQPLPLNEFLVNRVERAFLCVETRGQLNNAEIAEVLNQVSERLNYYQYVNIIVAPEDIEGLKQICNEAKCVHYVTNCTSDSVDTLKKIVSENNVENCARKLIIIDAPISPLTIADEVGIDPTQTKLITLPAVQEVRACALRHDRPFDYMDVVQIYEEAFR